MLNRITLTSLCTLPLWFSLGCGPHNLTVGDKEPTSSSDAGASGDDDKQSPGTDPGKVSPGGTTTGAGGEPSKTGTGAAGEPSSGTGGKPSGTGGKADPGAAGAAAEPVVLCFDGKTPIPQSNWCDGVQNCPDASDELKCANTLPFVCKDGTKLDPSLVCNDKSECPDGSDEVGCPPPPFVCKDGNKIPAAFVCTGKPECGDGSDELNCTDKCEAGIDQAPRYDPVKKCLLDAEAIGCAMLIHPDKSVPDNWPDTNCLHRKLDGVIFLVPEPQLALDWYECTPNEANLLTQVGFCSQN